MTTTTKQLLTKLVEQYLAKDTTAVKEIFHEYATLRTQELVEGKKGEIPAGFVPFTKKDSKKDDESKDSKDDEDKDEDSKDKKKDDESNDDKDSKEDKDSKDDEDKEDKKSKKDKKKD